MLPDFKYMWHFMIKTGEVECCVAAVKSVTVVIIISQESGLQYFQCQELNTVKADARGAIDVEVFIISHEQTKIIEIKEMQLSIAVAL